MSLRNGRKCPVIVYVCWRSRSPLATRASVRTCPDWALCVEADTRRRPDLAPRIPHSRNVTVKGGPKGVFVPNNFVLFHVETSRTMDDEAEREYERARQEQIKQNQELLASLGLNVSPFSALAPAGLSRRGDSTNGESNPRN